MIAEGVSHAAMGFKSASFQALETAWMALMTQLVMDGSQWHEGENRATASTTSSTKKIWKQWGDWVVREGVQGTMGTMGTIELGDGQYSCVDRAL